MESYAKDELICILEELGDTEPTVTITKMSGILTAKTKLDPFHVIRQIRQKMLDEPWYVWYCLRLIPIQRTVQTNHEEIERSVEELATQISKEDMYRITVERRGVGVSGRELISKIATKFHNKVSLESPDKIILIEQLGDETGVSIISKDDILSTEKVKRSLSE